MTTELNMLDDLKNKVAIITGSSKIDGIGCSIALVLKEMGVRIVTHAVHNIEGAKKIANMIDGYFIHADITNLNEVESLVRETIEHFGKLDILVNNAAVFFDGPAIDMNVEDWDNLMAVNLRGTFLCCQAAARVMKESHGGSIINISSLGSSMACPNLAAYCASKGGIEALTRSLACEWAPTIRVNAISPGHMNTPDNVVHMDSSQERKQKLSGSILMGDLGDTRQIGNAVAYLASEASKYITGQVITVDGGLSIWQGKIY